MCSKDKHKSASERKKKKTQKTGKLIYRKRGKKKKFKIITSGHKDFLHSVLNSQLDKIGNNNKEKCAPHVSTCILKTLSRLYTTVTREANIHAMCGKKGGGVKSR